jgi:hypothetical protein
MDWKKLAEEAQQLEEEQVKQKEAEKEPPPPKLVAGDTLFHPTIGKCNYAGDRGDGVFFVRGPDGRMLQLSHKFVRVVAVQGKARQYNIVMRSA